MSHLRILLHCRLWSVVDFEGKGLRVCIDKLPGDMRGLQGCRLLWVTRLKMTMMSLAWAFSSCSVSPVLFSVVFFLCSRLHLLNCATTYDSTPGSVCSFLLHTYFLVLEGEGSVLSQNAYSFLGRLSIPSAWTRSACFTYTLLTRLTCSLVPEPKSVDACEHFCSSGSHSVTVLIFKSELATKIASQGDGEGRLSAGFLVTSEPTWSQFPL